MLRTPSFEPDTPSVPVSALPLLSVIVPCRDAAATLGVQLEALARQDYDGDWEVVVADNGSRDGSRELAGSFAARLPGLRVVDAGARPGAAHARNAGARAARGERLLFVDADDEVAPGWVRALAAALERAPLVASRFELRKLNPAWMGARLAHPQEHGLNPYTYPPFLPHAGGSGLGVSRRLFDSLEGFDESYSQLEDTDFCWRAQLAGAELGYAAGAVVHVRLRSDLAGNFRQMLAYGENNVRIYRAYRGRGMPRLGPASGLARWAKLLLSSPRLLGARGRAEWTAQLGWRLGRLRGCLRYRVAAL
jgi:GT2 family glycosyltransferase